MRLFVAARHAQSTLNVEGRVNGDPGRPVGLTELGREEARQLGIQIANIPFEGCFHTRFSRTKETAALALAGRKVPFETEPLLDDIDVGDFDGAPVEEYREWKHSHARRERFPGGESLDDAAARYAQGWRRVLETAHAAVLIVCHEIPLRYALNGANGSDSLDGPIHELRNAAPYLFTEATLERAVEGIEALTAKAA
ncbi:MAG: histidine phosphatase family protein [Actinobacteria bacterium]|nr:histidine phosphatase family protein [Actinomycetota bacterium]